MLAPVIQISAVRAARAARRPLVSEWCALNRAAEQIAIRQMEIAAALQRDLMRIWWGV